MVFGVLSEVFSHKLYEQFTKLLAKWWVEPFNLSVSISSSVLSTVIIEKWWKMSTILYYWFTDRFNIVKFFLITG